MKKKLKLIILLIGILIGVGFLILAVDESRKIETEKSEKRAEDKITQDFKSKEEIEQEFDGWIKMLRSHASPKAGEIWEVTFLTQGKGNLEIIPEDEKTVKDVDFVSLACGDREINPEIKEGNVIYVAGWQCDEKVTTLQHLVNVEGKHALRFNFQAYYAFAYNSPNSVTDSFTDTSLISDYYGVVIDTGIGEVILNAPPKRVFRSSQTWPGNLEGTGGAGKKCNELAQTAGLGGEWDAWISDVKSSPSTRFNRSVGGYIRIDGVLVARSWTELVSFSNLRATITIDELGGSGGVRFIWTNTSTEGQHLTHNRTCGGGWFDSDGGLVGRVGDSLSVNWQQWTDCAVDFACDTLRGLYCFEQ